MAVPGRLLVGASIVAALVVGVVGAVFEAGTVVLAVALVVAVVGFFLLAVPEISKIQKSKLIMPGRKFLYH